MACRGRRQDGRLLAVRGDDAAYGHVMSAQDSRDSAPERTVDGGTTRHTDVDRESGTNPGYRRVSSGSENAVAKWRLTCSGLQHQPGKLAVCCGGGRVGPGRRELKRDTNSKHPSERHQKDEYPQHHKTVGRVRRSRSSMTAAPRNLGQRDVGHRDPMTSCVRGRRSLNL